MTKTLALLGATGSIGHQTLQVARELGLRVAALTARNNVDKLEAQVRQFLPRLAVLYDPAAAQELRQRVSIWMWRCCPAPRGCWQPLLWRRPTRW